jgi:hypothetical protein
LLWREREILEQVLFKVVQERLVLEAGETRWLQAANRELEAAVRELRVSEVLRSAETTVLAEELGLSDNASLSELAGAAPEPWSSILLEHRDALRQLTLEIDDATAQSRLLLDAGARTVRETLLSINDAVATYDARGQAATGAARATRVDEQA